MAALVKVENLPSDYEVALTSDWHRGSKAHHKGAFDQLIDWIRSGEKRYLGFGGDAIEGKPMGSPHFDLASLHRDEALIGEQFKALVKEVAPIKDRILWWGLGNHDLYLSSDLNIVDDLFCSPLGITHRMGGYQTWVDLGGEKGSQFKIHDYHGSAPMPQMAKDPIQREGNQRAWLVRKLSPLAGDCLVQLMGHVHALVIQKPIQAYALLSKDGEVRARNFIEPTQQVITTGHNGEQDIRDFIPVLSRWYAITGTLRRSGGFGFIDYAEVKGYAPSPIGWCRMIVEAGTVADIQAVKV